MLEADRGIHGGKNGIKLVVVKNMTLSCYYSLAEGFRASYVIFQGFWCGAVVKNPPANAGDSRDMGSVPGLGRSPGEGNSNSLQYFCLENSRGPWQAMVPGVAKSWTWLSTSRMNWVVNCILFSHQTRIMPTVALELTPSPTSPRYW